MMQVHIYWCVCTHLYMYIYIYIYIHICVYVCIYVNVHTHTHTHTHVYSCSFSCTDTDIFKNYKSVHKIHVLGKPHDVDVGDEKTYSTQINLNKPNKAWWSLDLPQTSRANPVQCYSTHQDKQVHDVAVAMHAAPSREAYAYICEKRPRYLWKET